MRRRSAAISTPGEALAGERGRLRAGAGLYSDRSLRANPWRVTQDDIARTAHELAAAYGPAAINLMHRRTRAVRRRGDSESATLWLAVAKAIERELGAGGMRKRGGAAG